MAITAARFKAGNRLLDCLDERDRASMLAFAENVALSHGQLVYEQDAPLTHVYFPITAVCSSVVTMASGQIVETATTGNEGMLGAQAYLGVDVSLHRTVVQLAGAAFRMSSEAFRRLAASAPGVTRLVRQYLAYAMRYANQTVACNALHSVEERACRWLLMTHDRVGDGAFPLTHEALAEMLGTHRQTVSTVASTLQRAGLIQYRRGSLRILDRDALENASCECYAVTTHLFDQLVGC